MKKYKPNTPKTCTRCGLTQPTKKFPHTMTRGRMMARSWCAKCLSTYYRQRNRTKAASATKSKTTRASAKTSRKAKS